MHLGIGDAGLFLSSGGGAGCGAGRMAFPGGAGGAAELLGGLGGGAGNCSTAEVPAGAAGVALPGGAGNCSTAELPAGARGGSGGERGTVEVPAFGLAGTDGCGTAEVSAFGVAGMAFEGCLPLGGICTAELPMEE